MKAAVERLISGDIDCDRYELESQLDLGPIEESEIDPDSWIFKPDSTGDTLQLELPDWNPAPLHAADPADRFNFTIEVFGFTILTIRIR